MAETRVLFVCTGNSCRSVMAQQLLEHLLKRGGVDTVRVASAGVFAVEGMGATHETQRVLQEAGVQVVEHHARRLSGQMLEEADLVLVMERLHAEEVRRRLPSAHAKVQLLKCFGLSEGPVEALVDIPDPIGKPLEVYEVCFAHIREAVERVAKALGVKPA